MKNLKGGYQLIDLEKNDLSSSFTLEGLYETITLSNNKSLLVTGIVISGTKKNDVYTTYTKSGSNYFFVVYDKKIKVTSADAVTITDFTEYDPDRVDLINTETWGYSTATGTLTEAHFNLVKNNPNLILQFNYGAYISIANMYMYPVGRSTVDDYYQFVGIRSLSSTVKVVLFMINKTSGAYSIVEKTLS